MPPIVTRTPVLPVEACRLIPGFGGPLFLRRLQEFSRVGLRGVRAFEA